MWCSKSCRRALSASTTAAEAASSSSIACRQVSSAACMVRGKVWPELEALCQETV
ncbi:hypothetical protein PF005_g29096 [Phytophthora fragariae]|uniref:Uncharacterized protein n=1 Tax=Phytophthora fragariae TaxID=53985 RepID=A0A6A3VYI1_9STRA|nr:hypothetical protein PF007_g28717 [Phytophthora fragariae]KAE9166695.1 hypothetical protein PF005_g29096 [Phytophthora fragariae]KAE9175543.1 hypothetical protein PF002_g28766 [Phytophthora fragariae]KAE9271580.1 hypothetical protein PF001_g28318 [Phytophthora fragariae]